ncbi:tRNA (adenosine(37)-N6)-dimethylallyltransferase MiaA [Deinococcus radiophilus]
MPHHLLDVVDVTENYGVSGWIAEAEAVITDLLERGRRPLVVGGTGFYLRALTQGLPLAPAADPKLRSQLEAELAERGLDALLADIAQVRPDQLERMERNPRRVVRALEVYRQSGQFPSDFGHQAPRFTAQVFAFSPPLSELEKRAEARTRQMLAAGWPAEAEWLAAQVAPDTTPLPTAWQALGYREALALAHGHRTLDEAAEQITLATRRYAKRQRTFIRTQLGAELLSPQEGHAALRDFLTTNVQ